MNDEKSPARFASIKLSRVIGHWFSDTNTSDQ